MPKEVNTNAGSSKGRTDPFEGSDLGSSPSPAATLSAVLATETLKIVYKIMAVIRYLLFSIASITIFFAGIYFKQYPLVVIVAIIAFIYLIIDYVKTLQKINKKIDGEGIHRIISSDEEPGDPKEYKKGDLWIRYKK